MPKKKKASGAKIHQDAKAGRTVASAARSAAYFKLEAGRRATAKRLAGQTATTQAELEARKKKPKLPTHSQAAARLREGATRAIGLGRLIDVLKPKKKKKKK